MSLVTVQIQGSDGSTFTHIVDQVSSDIYPVSKLGFGAVGATPTLVSSSDPLPTSLSEVLALNQAVSLSADHILTRSSSFEDEVRIGRRTGVNGWTKFGYREGLTASAGQETVWATSGNFTPMTTASTFTIAYNNSTDGLGTTGALTLSFWYIDSSGEPAISVHTLSNTGSDVTSFSGLGINRIAVASSGTNDANGDVITVTETTGGSTQGVIPAGGSVTQQAIYHVGSNHDAVAKFLYLHINKPGGGGNAKIKILGYAYNRSVDTCYEVFRTTLDASVELTEIIDEPVGFNLSPTDVLYFVADTDTNGAEVVIRFSLREYQRS